MTLRCPCAVNVLIAPEDTAPHDSGAEGERNNQGGEYNELDKLLFWPADNIDKRPSCDHWDEKAWAVNTAFTEMFSYGKELCIEVFVPYSSIICDKLESYSITNNRAD